MMNTNIYTNADAARDNIEELKNIQVEGRKNLVAKIKAGVRFLFDDTRENKYDLPEMYRSMLNL